MLRIFTLVKIQRLRPGLNPRTREPEASMLTTEAVSEAYLLYKFPRGIHIIYKVEQSRSDKSGTFRNLTLCGLLHCKLRIGILLFAVI
jgi:hypothetical protein